MNKKHDVVGIGSPLLDIIVNVEEKVLRALGFEKGGMNLITKEDSDRILEYIKNHKKDIVSGGSAANTIAGTSLLGNKTALIGVLGDDEHGEIYEAQVCKDGICGALHKHDDHATGHAITFITPDGERTFATHLGAAAAIRDEHILEDDIKSGKVLHVEAYQLEDPLTREAMFRAIEIARENGAKISLDLSDPGLIERTGDLFKEVVDRHVDIVFANEDEAKKFTGLDSEGAVHEIASMCDMAIVKLGKKGSIIKSNGMLHRIDPYVIEEVNTNGAGDMYAAGILHGIVNGINMDETGKIASHLAALVVASPGARMDEKYHGEIEKYKISNS
ncbi:MAG: adenosine kinase [Candidatus Moranbacteria bacterium]|nr:adenosine kinase [Candidatus Moranbacteria bacterium]